MDNNQLAVSKVLTDVVNKGTRYLKNRDEVLKFTGIFTTEASKNKKMLLCTQESVITALMSCIYFNLIPNTPQGYAYLIPFKNKNNQKQELQFQLGYKGLMELARRSGKIKTLNPELVFPEDTFKVEYGTERSLIHIPDLSINRTDTDRYLSVYATAKTTDNEVSFEIINKQEMDRILKFISDKNAGNLGFAWKEWPDRMIKKTAIKKLLKYMPQSNEDISLALAIDSAQEANNVIRYNQETDNFDIEEPQELKPPVKKEVDISDLRSDYDSTKQPIDTNINNNIQ
jgi:recombination protein RecT